MVITLNYDNMLFLDAEDLAETGIKKAYDSLARDLGRYISPPAEVREVVDNDAPSFVVRCGDQEYLIYSPEVPNDEVRAGEERRMPFSRLSSEYRLYAINCGNELGGIPV